MRFDILTIFPSIVEPYFNDAIMHKAREAGLIDIATHNIRDWAADKQKTVDDAPYGGGPGMVMALPPIYRAVSELKREKLTSAHEASEARSKAPSVGRPPYGRSTEGRQKVVLLSAKGTPFTQTKAEEYAQLDRLILISGRYEGVDERVAEHIVDEEISVGPYILNGGELPAMTIVEATARLIPGVLGNMESIEERRAGEQFRAGDVAWPTPSSYPVYTRPEAFMTDEGEEWRVPEVLLSGDHAAIEGWRRERARG